MLRYSICVHNNEFIMDKKERLERQRIQRQASGNAYTKKYEKTHKGFLMRLYRNMLSRITGVQKEKYHLYIDRTLLEKETFYKWAISNTKFLSLFDEYKKSGFERKLAPSVDRVDSKIGYELTNMEWVTHSENSRRGVLSKQRKLNENSSS